MADDEYRIGRDADGDAVRSALYGILNEDVAFEEKATRALELGTEYLDLAHGHVAKIDSRSDYWEVIASTDGEDGAYPPGLVLDLQSTYCRRTIDEGSSLALHDAPEQGWETDPALEAHGLSCYHGTPITIDEETYGTVCFVSEQPRDPFDVEETMFAELVARGLEHDLERRRHRGQLTRQAKLINVLNRVLRHNLRNQMSVIRGHASLLADRFEATEETEIILQKVDDLIELSDKARTLESIVIEDLQREETDVDAVLDRVIASVETEFHGATISREGADGVTLAAIPSLETALHELVENAAEHAGESPTVTVTVDASPDAVRIHVADDGCGLDELEREVLTEGIETPLVHGAGLGLWLVYWIVNSHGGTIEATSTETGTKMTVTLPRVTAATDDAEQSAHEPKLRRVYDRFRAVFEEAFDAMVIVDDNAVCVDANERAADLYGLAKNDLLGRSLGEFVPAAVDFEPVWEEFLASGSDRGTIPVVRPDGSERVVEYSAAANIVPGQHLAVMRDVTDRVERERELSQLEQVLETLLSNVPVVLWTTDADGLFTRSRGQALSKLGLEPGEVVGDSVFDVYGDHPVIPELCERALDGECLADTVQVGEVTFEVWMHPLRSTDGDILGMVGLAYDITDRQDRPMPLAGNGPPE